MSHNFHCMCAVNTVELFILGYLILYISWVLKQSTNLRYQEILHVFTLVMLHIMYNPQIQVFTNNVVKPGNVVPTKLSDFTVVSRQPGSAQSSQQI